MGHPYDGVGREWIIGGTVPKIDEVYKEKAVSGASVSL